MVKKAIQKIIGKRLRVTNSSSNNSKNRKNRYKSAPFHNKEIKNNSNSNGSNNTQKSHINTLKTASRLRLEQQVRKSIAKITENEYNDTDNSKNNSNKRDNSRAKGAQSNEANEEAEEAVEAAVPPLPLAAVVYRSWKALSNANFSFFMLLFHSACAATKLRVSQSAWPSNSNSALDMDTNTLQKLFSTLSDSVEEELFNFRNPAKTVCFSSISSINQTIEQRIAIDGPIVIELEKQINAEQKKLELLIREKAANERRINAIIASKAVRSNGTVHQLLKVTNRDKNEMHLLPENTTTASIGFTASNRDLRNEMSTLYRMEEENVLRVAPIVERTSDFVALL